MKKIFLLALLCYFSNCAFGQTFTLSSIDVGGQFVTEFIAGSFGCNGSNKSPELHWQHPPEDTKSFAVTMYDMDAPTGSGFWHWVLIDIPPSSLNLQRGAGNPALKLSPAGSLHRLNDTGSLGYQGPCPGESESAHRYIITVYALNTKNVQVEPNAPAALTSFILNKSSIAKASLIVYCKR
jgi:Raf kinase inhibitor-like YbhB/YbcL family protein